MPKGNAARKLFLAFSIHFYYINFKINSSKIQHCFYTHLEQYLQDAAMCRVVVPGWAVLCSLPGDVLGCPPNKVTTVSRCCSHL